MSVAAGLIKDRLAGWHILIAEDDEDAMRVAARWFKLAGASVTCAADGQTALEIARRDLPMLIISDLHMPVVDGWQLCIALKADATTCGIPIIALTADHTAQAFRRTREVGFAGLIHKPLDPHKFIDDLFATIATIRELADQLPDYEGELSQV